jgi:hypothetical protein
MYETCSALMSMLSTLHLVVGQSGSWLSRLGRGDMTGIETAMPAIPNITHTHKYTNARTHTNTHIHRNTTFYLTFVFIGGVPVL